MTNKHNFVDKFVDAYYDNAYLPCVCGCDTPRTADHNKRGEGKTTVVCHIPPLEYKKLTRQAYKTGVTVDAYVAGLIRKAIYGGKGENNTL